MTFTFTFIVEEGGVVSLDTEGIPKGSHILFAVGRFSRYLRYEELEWLLGIILGA